MDAKQAGQIGAAALVFALIAFVTNVTLGVYVLYYQKNSSSTPKSSGMSRGMYGARSDMATARPLAPMPVMMQHKQGQPFQVPGAMYAAPPIPPAVASGPVGAFFDDEMPQA